MFQFICLSVCPSVRPFVHPSIHPVPPIYLSVCFCLYVCLYVYFVFPFPLNICLFSSIYFPVDCLFVYLSLYTHLGYGAEVEDTLVVNLLHVGNAVWYMLQCIHHQGV